MATRLVYLFENNLNITRMGTLKIFSSLSLIIRDIAIGLECFSFFGFVILMRAVKIHLMPKKENLTLQKT
jgi:hypothetical protein